MNIQKKKQKTNQNSSHVTKINKFVNENNLLEIKSIGSTLLFICYLLFFILSQYAQTDVHLIKLNKCVRQTHTQSHAHRHQGNCFQICLYFYFYPNPNVANHQLGYSINKYLEFSQKLCSQQLLLGVRYCVCVFWYVL